MSQGTVAILSYCVASILLTVTNKAVLSGYHFRMNFLLLACQVSAVMAVTNTRIALERSCLLFSCSFIVDINVVKSALLRIPLQRILFYLVLHVYPPPSSVLIIEITLISKIQIARCQTVVSRLARSGTYDLDRIQGHPISIHSRIHHIQEFDHRDDCVR